MDWRLAIGTAFCVVVLAVVYIGLMGAAEQHQLEHDAARAAARSAQQK